MGLTPSLLNILFQGGCGGPRALSGGCWGLDEVQQSDAKSRTDRTSHGQEILDAASESPSHPAWVDLSLQN